MRSYDLMVLEKQQSMNQRDQRFAVLETSSNFHSTLVIMPNRQTLEAVVLSLVCLGASFGCEIWGQRRS